MTPEEKAAFLETLSTFGLCDLTVDGKSMWPFIRPGDRVTIIARAGNPVLGSVAALFCGNQLIVHRIIRRIGRRDKGWKVLLSGDSSPGSFAHVEWSEIVGTVRCIDHAGKSYSAWFHPPLSLFAIALGYLLRLAVSIKQHHRPLP